MFLFNFTKRLMFAKFIYSFVNLIFLNIKYVQIVIDDYTYCYYRKREKAKVKRFIKPDHKIDMTKIDMK